MSRCFPFPHSGYDRNVADESLIDSIKLQKERQKVEDRKKEKKREKKEKEKKSRKKDGTMDEGKHSSKKRHKVESSQVRQQVGNYKEKRDDKIEQAEKSNLTEECGQPFSTQTFYNSSDSMCNSGKRKKHNTVTDSCHDHGCGLNIRLPLPKHKGSVPPSSAHRTETLGEVPETASKYGLYGSNCIGMQARYRDLMKSWNTPLLQIEHPDFDNQEWLFEMKQQCKHESKRCKISDGSVHVNVAGLVPHPCFLPACEIYALPYAVPY